MIKVTIVLLATILVFGCTTFPKQSDRTTSSIFDEARKIAKKEGVIVEGDLQVYRQKEGAIYTISFDAQRNWIILVVSQGNAMYAVGQFPGEPEEYLEGFRQNGAWILQRATTKEKAEENAAKILDVIKKTKKETKI